MPADPVAAARRETEHKARKVRGWMWNEEAKDFVGYTGLSLWWRFVGGRTWRRNTIVPTGDQTVEGLRAKLPEIVARLAEKASA